MDEKADDSDGGEKVVLKFRLSTCSDAKLTVLSTDSIAVVKHKLGKAENFDGKKCRLFMTGKQLGDKLTVGEITVPKGFFIQVLVPP